MLCNTLPSLSATLLQGCLQASSFTAFLLSLLPASLYAARRQEGREQGCTAATRSCELTGKLPGYALFIPTLNSARQRWEQP